MKLKVPKCLQIHWFFLSAVIGMGPHQQESALSQTFACEISQVRCRLRDAPVGAKGSIRLECSDRPHRRGLGLWSKEPNALKSFRRLESWKPAEGPTEQHKGL